MIYSPWTPLWCISDSPEDKSACNRSCNLQLGSIEQVQLLTEEVYGKQTILRNWIYSLAHHNNFGTHSDCSHACFNTRPSKSIINAWWTLWRCVDVVCAETVLIWTRTEASSPYMYNCTCAIDCVWCTMINLITAGLLRDWWTLFWKFWTAVEFTTQKFYLPVSYVE